MNQMNQIEEFWYSQMKKNKGFFLFFCILNQIIFSLFVGNFLNVILSQHRNDGKLVFKVQHIIPYKTQRFAL